MKISLLIIILFFSIKVSAKEWKPWAWNANNTLSYKIFFLDNNHKIKSYFYGYKTPKLKVGEQAEPLDTLHDAMVIRLLDNSHAMWSINYFNGDWQKKYYRRLFEDSSISIKHDTLFESKNNHLPDEYIITDAIDSLFFNVSLKNNRIIYTNSNVNLLNSYPLKGGLDSFQVPFFSYPFILPDAYGTPTLDGTYQKPTSFSYQSSDTIIEINDIPINCTNYILYFSNYPLDNWQNIAYIGSWKIIFENQYHLPIRIERNVLSRESNFNWSTSDTTHQDANYLWYKTFVLELEDLEN